MGDADGQKKKSVNSVTTICRWILDQQRKQHSVSSAKKRRKQFAAAHSNDAPRLGGAIAAVSLMKDQLKYFASISIPSSTHVNSAYGRSSLTTLTALREVSTIPAFPTTNCWRLRKPQGASLKSSNLLSSARQIRKITLAHICTMLENVTKLAASS